jgi:hypothetical protein
MEKQAGRALSLAEFVASPRGLAEYESGPVASSLDSRCRELEAELKRVERERDI